MLLERVSFGSIVLRPLAAADAPRVAELCAAREVADMTALIPHPYTEAMAREWIGSGAGTVVEEHTYAVLRRNDELLIGALGLRPQPAASDMVGYWIGVPYWGRGYATQSLEAALALAFTWLDLEVVRARHLVRNPASGRVMEKCGMVEVGRDMRSHRGGAPEAFAIRAITRDAWEARVEWGRG